MWISKQKFDNLVHEAKEMLVALENLKDQAYLISIERSGRELVFTFKRNDEVYQVKCMSMISDNLPEWKAKLLR